MKQLEIEELQACVIEAIREVQQGETIEVLSEGKVVAVLGPVPKPLAVPFDIEERRAALARLDALTEEIGKHLTGPIDVTEILAEMRRY